MYPTRIFNRQAENPRGQERERKLPLHPLVHFAAQASECSTTTAALATMRLPVVVVVLLASVAEAAAGCPSQCNAQLGWGTCLSHTHGAQQTDSAQSTLRVHFRKPSLNHSCKCKSGHGGKDCSFQMTTIYYSEEVYSGLEMQPLDLQGWGSDLPETVALYRRLCEV